MAVAVIVVLVIVWRSLLAQSPAPVSANAAGIVVYAVRADAAVRDAPTTLNSNKLGTLDRGVEIHGAWLPLNAAGYQWFKIGLGPYAGNYVWGRSVSNSAPPVLSAEFNIEKTALSVATVFSSPDTSSQVVDTIRAQRTAYVVGALAGGWYEVRLKHGGVGYVQSSVFD